MPRFLSIAAALALSGCTFARTEQAPAPVPTASSAGRALAETKCAQCHAIGVSDTSPYPGAQPFRVFWQRWTKPALASALTAGILVQHDQSGVNLPAMKLEEAEIKALFAYLDTIQQK